MSEGAAIEPVKGPLVSVFLCDSHIVGNDGVLSAIRIIDRSRSVIQVGVREGETDMADIDLLPSQAVFRVVVLMQLLPEGTSARVGIRIHDPRLRPVTQEAESRVYPRDRALRSANIVHVVNFDFIESGVYWVVVRINRREVARVPIQLARTVEIVRIPQEEIARGASS